MSPVIPDIYEITDIYITLTEYDGSYTLNN